MEKKQEKRLKLRISSLKDITESYSLSESTKDLEELEKGLKDLEEEKALEKINDIEKKVRKEIEKEKGLQ